MDEKRIERYGWDEDDVEITPPKEDKPKPKPTKDDAKRTKDDDDK